MSNCLIVTNRSTELYKFRRHFLQSLSKHSVSISIAMDVSEGKSVSYFNSLNCKIYNVPMNRRGKNLIEEFALFNRYKRVLRSTRPSFVITYTVKPNIYLGILCAKANIPYYVNVSGLGSSFYGTRFFRFFIVNLYRYALRNVDRVFFENSENAEIFIDKKIVKKDKTVVLKGAGVDLNYHQYQEYPTSDTVKFLFMGRIMKEKGILELLGALHKAFDNGYNFKLIVAGEFEEDYTSLFKEYAEEGWLDYRGYCSDVRKLIKECHCGVLPSWHEGMSNSNLEIAASGRPLITSDIHGCKEAVLNNETGLLFEVKSEKDLYDKVITFLTLPYQDKCKMGYSARKYMEQHFDKAKVVEQTIANIDALDS